MVHSLLMHMLGRFLFKLFKSVPASSENLCPDQGPGPPEPKQSKSQTRRRGTKREPRPTQEPTQEDQGPAAARALERGGNPGPRGEQDRYSGDICHLLPPLLASFWNISVTNCANEPPI